MTITIGQLIFDHMTYDAAGDVLYLHVGEPQEATDADETPEGHVVRYGADDQVIGLTLTNVKWLLDRDGSIAVTVPHQVTVEPTMLAPAINAA
jgi:uncharacterized protein YuzE